LNILLVLYGRLTAFVLTKNFPNLKQLRNTFLCGWTKQNWNCKMSWSRR